MSKARSYMVNFKKRYTFNNLLDLSQRANKITYTNSGKLSMDLDRLHDSKIEAYFAKEKFVRCSSEHTLFTKRVHGKFLIVSLYVDDLIFAGNCKDICEEFKSSMQLEFDMTDLGKMRHFLGIEVIQNEVGIFICQRQYAREILLRFNMLESNSIRNPMVPGTILSKDDVGAPVDVTKFKQVVGSLMYLTATRPDLMYGVNLISRYMANPKESHWAAAKRIFRYLKGTIDHGLFYQKGKKNRFHNLQ